MALAVVATVVAVAGVGGAAARSSSSSPHGNGIGANYTVELPNEQDHYPGEKGGQASIHHLSSAKKVFEENNAQGFEQLEYIVISSQEVDFSACTTDNTRAFGIDRGNDDPGTQTDDPLLKHREDSSFKPNKIVVKFFTDDSIAGEPVHLNKTDQIVAVQENCYKMPQEPGWYQINARTNGTTYQGDHVDQQGIKSHYFYVCECSNEQEARNTLGPPPSEGGSGGDGGGGGGGGAGDSPTASPSNGGGNGGNGGGGGGGGDTQTASTATDGNATDGNATDTTTGNGTATETTTTGGDGGGGGAGEETATASPTDDSGPGFGVAAALVALLGAALLAARRTR